ncbi:MAG TPA: DUF2252 domain-containing protein [Aliidongia sp.]|nr:DUF2252 domain-containing protein [Aliidongia sp.]
MAKRRPVEPASAAPPSSSVQTFAERRGIGRRLRTETPRESHAGWDPPADRRDPIDILIETGRARVQSLLPVRYARMLDSSFAFLRGSAAVMAADLATTADSGIRVQACGDCHLVNFGVYASPEGRAIFDINDFDETLPAPFEWDVKRLAASIVLAGRHAQLGERASAKAARAAARIYRERMAELARLDPLAVWSTRVDVAQLVSEIEDPKLRASQERRLAEAAQTMPAFQDFPRLAALADGIWRIRDNPPLIYHFDQEADSADRLRIHDVFAQYRETLPDERKLLYDRYRLIDTAFKVVGIGSVGTFCAIGLFMTPDEAPLFLQIKEAQASVLEAYAGKSRYDNEGQRVVVGQRVMQSASDLFLGWTHDGDAGRHFYVRQLKDRKLASVAAIMEREALRFYAELCGSTLARAHARSGDAALISGYLGSSEAFDAAIQEFAVDYADQSERDHRLLTQAVRSGRLEARLDPATR